MKERQKEPIMNTLVKAAYFSGNIQAQNAHYHDCHQIILIVKGDIRYTINDIRYNASRGDIVITSRYEKHSVQILSKEYERYVLHLSPFANSASNRLYALLSNRPSGFKNILNASDYLEDFIHIFKSITNENHENQLLTSEMLESLIHQLLIMVYRLAPQTTNFFDDTNFKMVSDIQKRFEEAYQEQYTLDALSKEYHISISSLSHQFKNVTGVAVMNYLLSCRIASAKKYLAETNISIGEIVDNCGFSDVNNFCRTFKKINGLTPSAFRAKYK